MKEIYVQLLKQDRTGLYAAVSRDLPGLMIHDYSIAEIERRLPIVIRELLEAAGHEVESVTAERDEKIDLAHLQPPAYIANAVLTRVAA